MDEFAQSREDDDLFADEFEPVTEPTVEVEQRKHVVDRERSGGGEGRGGASGVQSQGHQHQQQKQQYGGSREQHQNGERRQRGGGGRGGRERGGGGGGGASGLSGSRYALPVESPSTTTTNTAPVVENNTTNKDISAPTSPTSDPTASPIDPAQAQTQQPPTQPQMPQRIPAVRGDRSATGGPLHKKLTEEELTAKLAQMAIINAQKAERHRLSEADQAAFQHREKELAKERKEKAVAEKRNERVMEMERAKNRERKMKAQGGREWDSFKEESDIVDGKGRGRSSEFVRGGFGGVIRGRGNGLKGSLYSADTDEVPNSDTRPENPRGGRGGTFEIRGRGGRGGRAGFRGNNSKPLNSIPTKEDFPALPSASNKSSPLPANSSKEAIPLPDELKPPSPLAGAGDWADLNNRPEIGSGDWAELKSPTGKGPGDWADEMATPVLEKGDGTWSGAAKGKGDDDGGNWGTAGGGHDTKDASGNMW